MKISTLTLNPALDRSILLESDFANGGAFSVSSAVLTPGGKGINCSRMLKNLGVEATCYGFAGGMNGRILLSLLEKEQIKTSLTQTQSETRYNVKITDKKGVQTELNEKGGPIAKSELETLEKTLLSSQFDIILLCGSLPKGIKADYYAELTDKLKKAGKKVFLDTSKEPLERAIVSKPDLIKPNLDEFCTLMHIENNGELPIEYLKSFYKDTGIEVILTMGGDGSAYIGKSGLYRIKTPRIKAKGFTGAGDTFLSSYTYMLVKSNDTKTALIFGAAASLTKVAKEGALLPTREEIEANIGKIEVSEM